MIRRRWLPGLLVVVAATLVWAVVAAPSRAVAAGAEAAGEAVIVGAGDLSRPIESGASATSFVLRLPPDASCPGDSANDGYRVQSFIMPATDDPAVVDFESTKPQGDGRWGLYQANTHPFINGLTEMNDGPGRPGRIDGVPPFSFEIYPPGLFADGKYRLGIACSLYNETERFWDTRIVLTNDAEDQPAQLRWRTVNEMSSTSDGSPSKTLLVATFGAVVLAAGPVYARNRSRNRSETISQEH